MRTDHFPDARVNCFHEQFITAMPNPETGEIKMRYLPIVLSVLLGSVAPTHAQVSVGVGISLPGVSIGINVPSYPRLVQVPGYPVYYDPRANSNYFFYDGLYWVYLGDNWYASSWYNGPWQLTAPEYVPLFVLRIPVRYYRQPPVYFRGWRADAPPRWGDHWGRDWEQRRSGWDQWDRRSAPRAAPLPIYQRQYSGNRYPRAAEQQNSIRSGNYRYQPRDTETQQHFEPRSNSRVEPQQQAPVHLNQQRQRPPQAQHPQFEPQDKARDKKETRQDKRRDNKNEDRGQDRP
ncbi:hypothetical protein [Polaromonas sp.]|uniref:hypothetical protein n=1 Tax=Polaromonas sp. TaxID=1869339 RepID=UPI00272FE80D|nr:hypothetical protein [Polaromonas sp.]MDP1888960.1 hypothetical protein [Polaromonas sp.]